MNKPEDSLWKIIARYDVYFGSTNAKAAFLIAYNTFSIGAGLTQFAALNGQNVAFVKFGTLASVALICLASIASLVSVMRVVYPYLASHRKPGEYDSAVFFKDVAYHASPEDYEKYILGYSDDKMATDLARQAYHLAKGLDLKFKRLRVSILIILWGQVPGVLALVMLNIYSKI